MSFTDLAKKHADFMSRHAFGEEVEYLPHGEVVPRLVRAIVRRDPADPLGQVLVNAIRLYVPKVDVVGICVGRDKFRICDPHRKAGDKVPEYTVATVESQGPGHYWVTAHR